ncbi:MAG: 6-bladed beta-propeller [Dysgonamonadaceae bacterium]|jgi:hypothetical protein|nr:6-bladed beta-propeller [Dysgonamonadaceae bacterium]
MRKVKIWAFTVVVSFTFVFASCSKKSQHNETDIITVDITEQYPKGEAIPLQDIATVKYIPLETNDEFLCGNDASPAYIDDDIIVFRNDFSDGTILLFDGAGKTLKRINRKGQSGEEYLNVSQLIYDKERDELFVNDGAKIQVYDSDGNFKRTLSYAEDKEYRRIYNFDKDYLLCYYDHASFVNMAIYEDPIKNLMPSFILVSKQTGEKLKGVPIPYEKWIDGFILIDEGSVCSSTIFMYPAVKNGNGFLLNEISADTIFRLQPDFSTIPVMTRKPSVQKMNPPYFLVSVAETPHYHFMTSVKKGDGKSDIFPSRSLMYDKQTGEISEQNFYNADISNKENLIFGKGDFDVTNNLHPIGANRFYIVYDAFRLKEMNENGELTGQLKEIAAKIDADDNPVVMVVQF